VVRLLASRNVCGASADANASACTALLSSMPHRLAVDVLPTNHPPTFAMPEYLGAVEGAGPQAVRGFVHAISTGSAAAHEAGQRVHFAVSGQDDEGVAFVEAPRVDPDGTLRFAVAPGAHGVASLAVVASDDGGLDPRSFNASSAPRPLLLKVFPRPVVSAVVPRVGPASGGGRLTVHGAHFGSKYSRGFAPDGPASAYDGLSVLVGGAPCGRLELVSDHEVRCDVPRGLGAAAVSVNISDGALTRSGALPERAAYTHVLFYLGGTRSLPRSRGFVALGPRAASLASPGSLVPAVDDAELPLSKTVRAVLPLDGTVYMGGDFTSVGGSQSSNVVAWDGARAAPLANGVDGVVYALAALEGRLVVGGAFTRAFQRQGSLRCGGLAAWTGAAWACLGPDIVDGVVHALAVRGTRLYVGGVFNRIGPLAAHGVAAYDAAAGAWAPLGGAVSGGAVSALAAAGDVELFVGGRFSRIGAEPIARLARWDGARWYGVGAIDGEVHALAWHAGTLYVGGEFVSAGGVPAANLAVSPPPALVLSGHAASLPPY